MSVGCGTLAGPAGFKFREKTGKTVVEASLNGKQHTLPASPGHTMITKDDCLAHWEIPKTSGTTRLWGKVKPTKYGGEERPDGTSDLWTTGEFWNVDSNIRMWGEHEVRRNAASASHDVHRHDQYDRMVLPRQQANERFWDGTLKRERPLKQSVSGMLSADTNFLETYGFDLGQRDRQGRPATIWNPVGTREHFRAGRSYNRNISRMHNTQRNLRITMSAPGITPLSAPPPPEDVGGDAGAHGEDTEKLETNGKTHGSRSCRGWDRYDHAVKRESAKMSNGVFSPFHNSHPEAYPFVDNVELRPAAVYTRKFKEGGEASCRAHESRATRVSTMTPNGYFSRTG